VLQRKTIEGKEKRIIHREGTLNKTTCFARVDDRIETILLIKLDRVLPTGSDVTGVTRGNVFSTIARDGMGDAMRAVLFCAHVADRTRTERQHEGQDDETLARFARRKCMTRDIARRDGGG